MALKLISASEVPALESKDPLTTEQGPQLLDNGGGVFHLTPTSGSFRMSYVAYWIWLIAGRVCASPFEVVDTDSRERQIEKAVLARQALVDFVRAKLAPIEYGGVGVVEDGGTLPVPR